MGIRLLDCTLRDGGHQNNSKFGEDVIRNIIAGLCKSKTDYIEIGFLRENNIGIDYAASNDIREFEKRFCFCANNRNTEYTVMIQEDQYDINKLPVCEGHIKQIRVSFHDYDREAGLEYCRGVIKRGYRCHVNPINIVGYSDAEVLELIAAVNDMGACTFTLVDTFGSMLKEDLLRLLMLADNNLKPDITIGFHLHDNLQMAFSLAQTIADSVSDKRDIIIDGSLLGMGREPGNLCIELMMEYLNSKKGAGYDVDAALDVIDAYITGLKAIYPWGYETAYSLSAQYRMHRSYAEYLMKKQKLKTKQIKQILGMVEKSRKARYDESYIEQLYNKVVDLEIDDNAFRRRLLNEVGNKKVLLMAPGHSLKDYDKKLKVFCRENDVFVIAANFEPPNMEYNYIFCSNVKRLDRIKESVPSSRLIVSAHLEGEFEGNANKVNTNELGWFGNLFWDNCMLMLLHLVERLGIRECHIAGWDGFSGKDNFVAACMESIYRYDEENIKVTEILDSCFQKMTLHFLTPSIYRKG